MAVNFMAISYRGFGVSEGSPTQPGVCLDSQAALSFLLEQKEVDKNKIILFGHSLGGSVALHLAASNQGFFSAIVLENTFLCLSKVFFANQTFANILDRVLLDRWNSQAQISKILSSHHRAPHFLVMYGSKDSVVPPRNSKGILKMLRSDGPDTVIVGEHVFTQASHTCHQEPDYHDHIVTFLRLVNLIS